MFCARLLRQGGGMMNLHLVGCASALYDNLALCWRRRAASLEQSPADELPAAIARIGARPPAWVVYCGPAARSSWEEPTLRDDDAHRVEQLARATRDAGCGLAVISSDEVFAGPTMFHDENEPAARTEQAQRLSAVEQAALNADGGTRRVLVVRTNAFGWSASGESFAERFWRALAASRMVEATASSFATPILASDLAEVLLRCFQARMHGIVHLGGAERASPFRFAQELAAVAGFDRRLVRGRDDDLPIDGCEGALDEAAGIRAKETSLASRLVRRELDVALPLLRESLTRFAAQAVSGYRDELFSMGDGALLCAA
jgi:dTDP-4-dehydrorhamnose reductase